jgi:HlyD family secretion protein
MQPNDLSRSIHRHTLSVVIAGGLLVASVGIMGAATEIAGAIIASGSLVVESSVKKIQHPTGGVVKELLITEGQHVNAGDLLIKLDETVARANLAAISKSYWELLSRKSRLEAERDGADEPEFPPELTSASNDPAVASTMNGERRLMTLRREARDNNKKQLNERIAQLRDEIVGRQEQLEAKQRESDLIEKELVAVQGLWEQKLVAMSRLTTLQREAARLLGDKGQLTSAIAQAKGKIAETTLQITQIDDEFRRDVAKELGDVRAKSEETLEKRVAASDVANKIDIRSPQSGFVHDLSVHTKGGVVSPGETLMVIVPDNDNLIVESRIAPQDIDQIKFDQDATLRFSNFNQRTTPEVNGRVARIGADISHDEKNGPGYFVVRVSIPANEVKRLGRVHLVPGMPVEIFIQTHERTVLSYLMRPLADQVRRAFREK